MSVTRACPPGPDAKPGYLWVLDDPLPPLSPVAYLGDRDVNLVTRDGRPFGPFANPVRGSPYRGEAVAYLASWTSRLAHASAPAYDPLYGIEYSFPSAVWETGAAGADGRPRVACADGLFSAAGFGEGPGLSPFRLRALDYRRLRRAPAAPPLSASQSDAPDLVRLVYDSDAQTPLPSEYDALPVAASYSVAASQAAADANLGKWLVPSRSPADPFSAQAGMAHLLRAAAGWAASVSAPQPDAALADGGFASGYASQGPEPARASDVRALFADALASGMSRCWALAWGIDPFAALAGTSWTEVPPVAETRWRYSVRAVFSVYDALNASLLAESDPVVLGPVEMGAAPDGSAQVRFLDASGEHGVVYDPLPGGGCRWDAWTTEFLSAYPTYGGAAYDSPGFYCPDGGVFPGRNLATLAALDLGTCAPSASEAAYFGHVLRCSLEVVRESYEAEVEPARRVLSRGSAPLSASGESALHPVVFSYESRAARVRNADEATSAELDARAAAKAAAKAAWAAALEGGHASALTFLDGAWQGGQEPAAPGSEWACPGVAEAWERASSGAGSSAEFGWEGAYGPVRHETRVRRVRGADRGSSAWWVLSCGGSAVPGWGGMNRSSETGELDGGVSEDGRFDLEYRGSVSRVRSPDACTPLAPGDGTPVPLASPDHVGIRPVFVAEVALEVRTYAVTGSTVAAEGCVGETYSRTSYQHQVRARTRRWTVSGFVPSAAEWIRAAGSGTGSASGDRYVLGGAGASALASFVSSRVLAACGLPAEARDLLGAAPALVWLERARRRGFSVDDPEAWWPCASHDAAVYHVEYRDSGGADRDDGGVLQLGGWEDAPGEYVVSADVSVDVSFPVCAFESGYCA